MLLLAAFVAAIGFFARFAGSGFDIEPGHEVAESMEKTDGSSHSRSLALVLPSLAAIAVGSGVLVTGSGRIISAVGLSDTLFGMTLLGLMLTKRMSRWGGRLLLVLYGAFVLGGYLLFGAGGLPY